MTETSVRRLVRELYEADTPRARKFRYSLLAFDIATVVFVIATSFAPRHTAIEIIDAVLGLIILADFVARTSAAARPMRSLLHLTTLADLAAIASFLAPVAGEGFGFLRVLRTLRLLRTYQMAKRLRADVPYFRRHEDILLATVNLGVFIFIMTGLVYETQYRTNPEIGNYADALYFTVTALTTTGFGDITLPGTTGRLISVSIMIFGVTLFLRLAQVLFRPPKVRQECPTCGLLRHDYDAVHCKHCGTTLHIRTEGGV
jgi:voltage-gated potassium channel